MAIGKKTKENLRFDCRVAVINRTVKSCDFVQHYRLEWHTELKCLTFDIFEGKTYIINLQHWQDWLQCLEFIATRGLKIWFCNYTQMPNFKHLEVFSLNHSWISGCLRHLASFGSFLMLPVTCLWVNFENLLKTRRAATVWRSRQQNYALIPLITPLACVSHFTWVLTDGRTFVVFVFGASIKEIKCFFQFNSL